MTPLLRIEVGSATPVSISRRSWAGLCSSIRFGSEIVGQTPPFTVRESGFRIQEPETINRAINSSIYKITLVDPTDIVPEHLAYKVSPSEWKKEAEWVLSISKTTPHLEF